MNSNLITFLDRIRQLTPNTKAKYGQMNVHQMVCHCTDFYRFVLGLLKLEEQPHHQCYGSTSAGAKP